MEGTKTTKQRRISTWLLGAFVLLLFTFLILLQSSNLWKNFSVDTASDTLLLYALSSLNFIAFVIFGFIFLRSIIKLLRERRALQLGSRIKTRLLVYFAAISILPIIAMAGFSYLFMNRALERWFTQIPENVVVEAKKVQKQAAAEQAVKLQETADMIAAMIGAQVPSEDELELLIEAGNLTRIEIVSGDNRILNASEATLNPEQKRQLDAMLASIKGGNTAAPELTDGAGFEAAIASMPGGKRLIIVPRPSSETSVTQIVDNSLQEFDRLKDKQITVRQVGLLTLGVLTFLLIFASTWTAFYIARGLTVPLKALAEGADEIAQGNLSHRVDVFAEDELALLVATFNQMSAKLEENSAELKQRKRYIETVLQSLATGVISFDAENRVSTINWAAINILKLEDSDFTQLELEKLVSNENRVILERIISRAKRVGRASEQTVLQRENSDGNGEAESGVPVALTATSLSDQDGAVLVIEDLSELIAAQRASAWQEVARRMAHEIKNPLTPIQLSAERIAKRFRDAGARETSAVIGGLAPLIESRISSTDDNTANVIHEGTETILREVQSLKSMVDEFSRFARLPNAKLEPGDLNTTIRQAVTLYDGRLDGAEIEVNLAAELPTILLDTEQMKRVFVNLIDNSLEALGAEVADGRIVLTTRHDRARDIVVAEVSDNGKGIPARDLQMLFQPYFSTKGRGTGLGLAIVHRIVTEHGGKIKAVGNKPTGAKFIVELPVTA